MGIQLLLVLLLAANLVACGDDESGGTVPDDAIEVVATTVQIGALVQEIAGGHVELRTLMGSGVDPHDYSATPADLRAIGDADLILKNGIGLDDFLDDIIDAAGGDAEVVTVTTGIDLIESGFEHDHEDDHGDHDPHVWHDPANVRVMVDNIIAALSRADAANADLYEENGTRYGAVLDETDAEIRALFDTIPVDERKLITIHDAFAYFIHAYDLELVGTVVPSSSTDAEPSAREIAELSELIERENVKAIFAEETVDPRVAEQLANDTGVEIVYGLHSDSLGEPGSGADTIHGMLLANATKISEALQ